MILKPKIFGFFAKYHIENFKVDQMGNLLSIQPAMHAASPIYQRIVCHFRYLHLSILIIPFTYLLVYALFYISQDKQISLNEMEIDEAI